MLKQLKKTSLTLVALSAALSLIILSQTSALAANIHLIKSIKPTPAISQYQGNRYPPQSSSIPVGSLKGSFKVTKVGAASYSIPLATPPGTAGISPLLSISYSSNQKNGLLGMGFSLTGLTAITRCNANITQNGYRHSVDYTNKDRFCLDGEQLVAINGDYGANQTEYRTYLDSHSRIISYASKTGGPQSFKVWTKSGQIAEYATSDDARILTSNNKTTKVWALNKVSDNAGNYMQIHYQKNSHDGSFYPSEIDYTGNQNANLTPYNKIKFVYQDRPDPIVSYRAGEIAKIAKLLTEIQTFSGDDLVYDYQLKYTVTPNTLRSRLTTIQQCDNHGECLPATKFDWQTTQNPTWQLAPNMQPPTAFTDQGVDLGARLVDLNGDGLVDLIRSEYDMRSNEWVESNAWLNQGDSWKHDATYAPPVAITKLETDKGLDYGVRFADLTGNGLPDLIQSYQECEGILQADCSKSRYAIWLNTPNGWQKDSNYNPKGNFTLADYNGYTESQLLDLNGDGLADATTGISDIKIMKKSFLNKNGSWIEDDGYTPPTAFKNCQVDEDFHFNCEDNGVALVDLNGNGLPDIIKAPLDSDDANAWLNSGTSWQEDAKQKLPFSIIDQFHNRIATFIDLNGDGLDDVIESVYFDDNGSSTSKAYLNTGAGWIEAPQFAPPIPLLHCSTNSDKEIHCQNSEGAAFVDLNTNGLPDLIINNGTGNNGVWLNTGNGWQQTTNYTPPVPISDSKGKDVGTRFVDLNGNGIIDIIQSDSESGQNSYHNSQQYPDLLTDINEGFGTDIHIQYSPITNNKTYTKEHDAVYPVQDIQRPLYVVNQTSEANQSNDKLTQNEQNGLHVTQYHYQGAKQQLLGLGFLGFHQITTEDLSSGLTQITTYSQDYTNHTDGEITQEISQLADGTVINSVTNSWAYKTYGDKTTNQTYYLPYTQQITTKAYDLKGNLTTTKTQKFTIDDYGNPTQLIDTSEDANGVHTITTENKYQNLTTGGKWLLGLVTNTQVTATQDGKNPLTRTSDFNYDIQNGLLISTTSEPNNKQYSLNTKYDHDKFGNITTTTISGTDIKTRSSKITYDKTGRFAITQTNALQQVTQQTFDPNLGKVLTITNPNGLTTKFSYDSFGRKITTTQPDGSLETLTYNWCDKNCPEHALYKITRQKSGEPNISEYFDSKERRVATETQGGDGETIMTATEYDNLGRVVAKTLPHFPQDQSYFIRFKYDVLGRVLTTIHPDGSITTNSYSGLLTTKTNSANQITTQLLNSQGKTLSSSDNQNNTLNYSYDSFGQITQIDDDHGNLTKFKYDLLGHRSDLFSPDRGHIHYLYNVLGQLISQTDAKGETTIFNYDKLGRLTSRTDPSGTSSWEYDNAPYAIGKLVKVNGITGAQGKKANAVQVIQGVNDGILNYTQTLSYDNLDRISNITTTIGTQQFTHSFHYNKLNRIDSEIYPSGIKTKNSYNQFGYLTQISDADTKQVYWQLNKKDAAGHIVSVTLNNSLIRSIDYNQQNRYIDSIETNLTPNLEAQKSLLPITNHKGANKSNNTKTKNNSLIQKLNFAYDSIGNLTTRQDLVHNTTENFSYDSLNRLIETDNSTGSNTLYEYDQLGNIIAKSNIGNLHYGENGAPPHAVTSISAIHNATFQYDENGNQTSATIDGKTRNITYSSFNKPLTIQNNDSTTSFSYSANRVRYQRIDKTKNKTITTFYIGNYQLQTINDGKNTTYLQKNFITPDVLVTLDNSNQRHSYSLLKDNLGSLTDIVDSNGNVLRHFSYTPFGEQTQTTSNTEATPQIYMGFTGHEEIPNMHLIHMNGRLYDPWLGRFLTPDPANDISIDLQTLNGYTYVNNNPLRFIDPSGYFLDDIIDFVSDVIGGIADFVGDCIDAVAGFVGDILDSELLQNALQIAASAVLVATGNSWALPLVSAGMTAISGGDFADILKSGIISFVTMETWHYTGIMLRNVETPTRLLTHGIVGGTLSEIQGGNFQDGFLASITSEAIGGPIRDTTQISHDTFSILKRTATSGLIGGTVAAISGGNFLNGAATGAFSRLFNEELNAQLFNAYEDAASLRTALGKDGFIVGERNLDTMHDFEFISPLTNEYNVDLAHSTAFFTDDLGNLYSAAYYNTGIVIEGPYPVANSSYAQGDPMRYMEEISDVPRYLYGNVQHYNGGELNLLKEHFTKQSYNNYNENCQIYTKAVGAVNNLNGSIF